jgi:hypothetical protein
MARPISKTTKFILALPNTLSAKEVLSKAKASGHKTTESNIYRVRRLHGGKTGAAKKTSGASASPAKRASTSGDKSTTKSDFVRSVSASTPAKDVVAKAKAAGIKLDIQYVYKVRSRPKGTKVSRSVQADATTKANGAHSSTEDILRAAAAELGLGRAMGVLQSQRARVSAVLRRKNPAPCPHEKYRPTCEQACGCGHACMDHDDAGWCTVDDCGCTDLFANTPPRR